MKESNVIRICQITKSSMASINKSEIILYYDEVNGYWVDVITDSEGLFEDLDIEFESNVGNDVAIKIFEEECLNRFTCFNEFSIDEILEQGEIIEFLFIE